MRLSTTIAAPRERVFAFLTDFDNHPRASGAFKNRKLLLRMANELHARGHVEVAGRAVVEEGRFTPYPPDRILMEETFPGLGRSEGTIQLVEMGDRTRVDVEVDFQPFARHLVWFRAWRGRRWVRAYLRGGVLGPFKAALEDPDRLTPAEAAGPPPTEDAREAARGVLFDREAEAQAREELLRREGKKPSAGVSPSGEERPKH